MLTVQFHIHTEHALQEDTPLSLAFGNSSIAYNY